MENEKDNMVMDEPMRMPSGKAYTPLDRPTPGQSLTKPMGQYPWERPPKATDPTVALAIMLDRFQDRNNMARTLAVLKEGISIKALAQGLILTGFTAGLFNANVAELIRPDLENYLEIIARKAKIDFVRGRDNKNNNKDFYNALSDLRDEKKTIEEFSKEETEPADLVEIIEEEETESLMKKPNTKSIMAKGDI
tara:strand:+ start:1511 stop:2092 length:582 start_codon:yes stop_codon:yes gene_type:complete